jgi:pyruvate,water dikinase
LRRDGFPVPDGVVLTIAAGRLFYSENDLGIDSPPDVFERAEVPAAIRAALEAIALSGPWAVRSSAVDEATADASYAGLYRTVLNVAGGEQLCRAVLQCWSAIASPGLRAYRDALSHAGEPQLALLVQRQLRCRVSGASCTADPVTGKNVVVVGAARGPALVDGVGADEQWVLEPGGELVCRRGEGVLSEAEVRAVAALAKEVAERFGAPQEIEWAFEDERLYLLQCRPLSTTPFKWEAPAPGSYLRNMRLGAWLGAPLSPLAADWLIPALERGASDFRRQWVGLPMPDPASVLVNGWYFASVNYGPHGLSDALLMIARILLHMARHPRRGTIVFAGPLSDVATGEAVGEWDEVVRPRQERLVYDGERTVEELDKRGLFELTERLVSAAAHGFGLFSAICGAAWKSELLLAEHYRRHSDGTEYVPPQLLLCGLDDVPSFPGAVFSLDWSEPTASELGLEAGRDVLSERVELARETSCRARADILNGLASRPSARRRFERLLDRAVAAARLRSRCAGDITRTWSLMRRTLLKLGAAYVEEEMLDAADDIFFLERAEVAAFVEGQPVEIRAAARARRRLYRRRRAATPPLQLGELPAPFLRALKIAEALRGPSPAARGETLHGSPASPGRARGRVRLVLAPPDLDRLKNGEVLVVPLLTPAWVPLAAHAVAAVVDTGNHLMHACALAREIGLPCVVGAGDATSRLRTGEVVEVDGAAGTVERIDG